MPDTNNEALQQALLEYLKTKPTTKYPTNFGALCELALGATKLNTTFYIDFNKDAPRDNKFVIDIPYDLQLILRELFILCTEFDIDFRSPK